MRIMWLAAFVIFLAVEAATVSLSSIWFAGGSVAALVAQVCGAGWKMQLFVFVAVSFMLLLLVRPLTVGYLRKKKTSTNVERFVGRKVVVKTRIDNLAGTGNVSLAGETWLARAAKEGETFEPGAVVKIVSVTGAKFLVEPAEEN